MAETSATTSTMSQAALLREAARQTMRRKQAPEKASISLSNSIQASSSSPSPTKSVPTHPKGLGAAPSVVLDYGDPNDNSGSIVVDQQQTQPAQPPTQNGVSIAPPPPSLIKSSRRSSMTRARASADDLNENQAPGSREEGEISDEETKAKRQDKPSTTEDENAGAGLNGTTNGSGTPALKVGQSRSSAKQPPAPRRVNSISGMPPPPPPSNVHREPGPISPTASMASQNPISSRSLRSSSTLNGVKPPVRRHTVPTPQTHSFDGLDVDMGGPNGNDKLSPKTVKLNQEVFTKLLELGVDDANCRPGLPLTFEEFNTAKRLILDLLGYGMYPEDIANLPISKRLIVYCLRELKIRLPENITVDDIIPYDPPSEFIEDIEMSDSSPSPPEQPTISSPVSESSPVDMMQGVESTQIVEAPSTSPSPPDRTSTTITRLNPHAEPFTPSLSLRTTTGPSLLAMALPHQRILPPRPSSPISLPSSLPARPAFNYQSPTKSPVKAEVVTSPSPSPPPVEEPSPPPVEAVHEEPKPVEYTVSPTEKRRLELLEQKARMELLRRKLELRKKRADGGGSANATPTPRPDTPVDSPSATYTDTPTDFEQPSTILGGKRVASPPPMDIDSPVAAKHKAVTPIQAIAASVFLSSRPSTPSELGPKRGVKRPKADDFVEDLPVKRSARPGGIPPPVKRSSFAILNSSMPERHIITWVDDENVEVEESWAKLQESSSNGNGTTDADAAQFAAAAMAIGLPMTAEELEAARILEEERKVQREAKAVKLLQTQARLKRLELRKAEKKLRSMGSSMPEMAVVEALVQRLTQELSSIESKLPDRPSQTPNSAEGEAPSTPNPEVSTPSAEVRSELSVSVPELSTEPDSGDGSSPSVRDTIDIADDDKELSDSHYGFGEALHSTTEKTSPRPESEAADFDMLHLDAAAQTRFSTYTPPLMLTAIPSLSHSQHALLYSNDDTEPTLTPTATTDPSAQRKYLAFDPDRELCQYESGGGECRDPDCPDLHWKDLLPAGPASHS